MDARLGPLITLCVTAATLAAQGGRSPDQEPATFVTGTQYVRVDVYVTRDGVLVEDLRPEEVRVYEDGVPQTIAAFERVVIRPPNPFEPGREPRTLEDSWRLAADPRSRVFVLFLDRVLFGDGGLSRGQQYFSLFRQFHDLLGPDDLVAIMSPTMRADDLTFSRGIEALAALEREWLSPVSPDRPNLGSGWDETDLLYQACYPPGPNDTTAAQMSMRRHEQLTLDALEALAVRLGELREERKSLVLITDGWRMYLPDPDLGAPRSGGGDGLRTPRSPIGDRGRGDGPAIILTPRAVVTTNEAQRVQCETDRAALASLDHSRRLQAIIERANSSNVSFYPISPGLVAAPMAPGAAGSNRGMYAHATRLELQSALRELAEQTDGYAVVNTNNLSDGLQRIFADSSAYYLLGYTSTNPALDGSYRRISVRVDRPGVHVRARPAYVAAPPPIAASIEEKRGAGPALDPVGTAMAQLASLEAEGPLWLREAAWAWAGPGGTAGGFWLTGELETHGRRGVGGVTVDVTVLNGRDEPVLSRRVNLPAIHPAFALRVPDAGAIEPGEYLARVELRDADGAAVVSKTASVTVPRDPGPLGAAVLWRRGPSTGPQSVRAADVRFRRNERLRVEVPVLSPDPVSARLLDRTGAPLAVPLAVGERPDDLGPFRWAIVDLTLAPLAPGNYLIEIVHADATQLTAFRVVP